MKTTRLLTFIIATQFLTFASAQVEIDTLWTFTNCGQEGRLGPGLGQCEAEYSGTTLEGQISMDDFQGYQEWTVPYNGTYKIEALGAKGGSYSSYFLGGKGSRMQAEFTQSTEQAFYFIEDIENIEIGDWILSYNGDEVIGARQWQGTIIDVPAMGGLRLYQRLYRSWLSTKL